MYVVRPKLEPPEIKVRAEDNRECGGKRKEGSDGRQQIVVCVKYFHGMSLRQGNMGTGAGLNPVLSRPKSIG